MRKRPRIKLPSLYSTTMLSKTRVKLPSRFYNPLRKKRRTRYSAKFLKDQNNKFYRELIEKLEREMK